MSIETSERLTLDEMVEKYPDQLIQIFYQNENSHSPYKVPGYQEQTGFMDSRDTPMERQWCLD